MRQTFTTDRGNAAKEIDSTTERETSGTTRPEPLVPEARKHNHRDTKGNTA